jgi:hypothetical protein
MDDKWHDIGNDKQMKIVRNGKVAVIAPKDLSKSVVPLFCPLCEFPMKTIEDSNSYKKMNCCEQCEIHWTSYKDDFHLLKNSKEWKEYISNRVNKPKTLIKLK